MESIKKVVDDIERLAYSGKSKKEICQIRNCSEYSLTNAINELNDPTSSLYDRERYELLKEKFNDNLSFTPINLNPIISYKERLAIIEPLIMNEDMTLQNISETTELTLNQIHDTIRALNRPKTDIYDEKKYEVIKEKVKENANQNAPKNGIQESQYEDYLEKIEYYIGKKYLVNEVRQALSITEYEYRKIMNSLNNPQSSNYNSIRYEKLKIQMDKNANEKRAEAASINKIPCFAYEKTDLKLEITKKVARGEMNVFDAANELHMPLVEYILYILELKDIELKNFFRTILQPYGVFINEDSTKNLMSYPLKTQKEIVLMALTYRVSYKTISKMFGVSFKNVIETFKSFNDLYPSLCYLFLETYNEDEFHEKKAYNDAMLYWRERNELIKSLNEAKKNKEKEKCNQMNVQVKKLHSKIDDTIVVSLKEKKAVDLTQDERDLIAKYQLKYYLSERVCAMQLGFSRNTIQNCSKSLAERNMIFAEKIALHNGVYQEKSQSYTEQYNAEISRGGGSR